MVRVGICLHILVPELVSKRQLESKLTGLTKPVKFKFRFRHI
jgi:hypothetical protein